MEDIFYLNRCIELIEEKTKWGSSKDWSSSYYEELSKKITEETNISISSTTLKRLFGKKAYKAFYQPQWATKNALGIYLGYRDWNDFISAQNKNDEVHGSAQLLEDVHQNKNLPLQDSSKKNKRLHVHRLTASLCILFTLVIMFSYLYFMPQKELLHSIKFKSTDSTGLFPYTAVFKYDVSKVRSNNIELFDDIYTSYKLPKDKNLFTIWYTMPGYYNAKLRIDKKIVKSTGIHVLTEGWICMIDSNYYKKMEVTDGALYVSPQEAHEFGVNKNKLIWLEYRNIKDFKVDGDNYKIETRFKSEDEKTGIHCLDFELHVEYQHERSKVSFLQPGCARNVDLEFSEQDRNGQTSDLTAFAKYDLTQWHTLSLKVKNKHARIYLDGSFVYDLGYKNSLGVIKGLSLRFRGYGYVDFIKLFNEKQQLVYRDDF